jgi:hypothetical protein
MRFCTEEGHLATALILSPGRKMIVPRWDQRPRLVAPRRGPHAMPNGPGGRVLAGMPLLGSGGDLLRRAQAKEPRFVPCFENKVSAQALKTILAHFGLADQFCALGEDGTVDIVRLKFESRPALKGLNVLIDGAPRMPDLVAAVGPLAVMVFRDQATLKRASEVIPVFGDETGGDAAKARRRPLRRTVRRVRHKAPLRAQFE